MTSLLAWTEQQFDPRLNWDDIAWVRRLWAGKLVLKGIMDAEDARRAVDAGAMRLSYPTTVAGNSTGHLPRFACCPRSQRLLIAKRRFGSMAA